MKFVNYSYDNKECIGVLENDEIFPINDILKHMDGQTISSIL